MASIMTLLEFRSKMLEKDWTIKFRLWKLMGGDFFLGGEFLTLS